jgi:hypothetical protein
VSNVTSVWAVRAYSLHAIDTQGDLSMSIEPVAHLLRTAHIAYSRHAVAQCYRIWRRVNEDRLVDILLLPLAGLALSLFLLSLPGASDAIAEACAVACMP